MRVQARQKRLRRDGKTENENETVGLALSRGAACRVRPGPYRPPLASPVGAYIYIHCTNPFARESRVAPATW